MCKENEKNAKVENEAINNSIKGLTKLCYELTQKYEKLEEDMELLLSLEPISSASRILGKSRRIGCFLETVICIVYVRYGKLETQEIYTNIERKPIEFKAVEEDINFTVVELLIGAEDAKEIVYLFVDKQNKTVADITRWYKNEEKK